MERRLYRSNAEKMLFGVAGGIAEYFNVDPTLIRVGFAVAALLNGAGIILYIVLAIIMPKKPVTPPSGTESAPGGGTIAAGTEPAPSTPPPPADQPPAPPETRPEEETR